VLAPLVPEWLYVCKVLKVKEDSILVTFEGAYTAWVNAAELRPDDIGKNTRVLGFAGWWSGHHPGTVIERQGERVQVLYDNGSSKWTKLNKIVVPTDKLATPGAVVSIEPLNPNAALPSQGVASPHIHHWARRGIKLVLLGGVLGAGLGLALGLMQPTVMPWAGNELNRDTVITLCLLGSMIGGVLAIVVSTRLVLMDIRKRLGSEAGVAGPQRATTPGTFRSIRGWVLPVAAGVAVVLSVLGWHNRAAVWTWVLGGQEITVSADDPDVRVTLSGPDHPALDDVRPGLYVLSLPPGRYHLSVRCGSGRKLESVVMREWRGFPGYANMHGRDFEEQRDTLTIREQWFNLEVKRGQRLVLAIKTSVVK
jgi:hypothetical protein